MILIDKIYGRVIIDSPVILALLKSVPLKRLKNINHFGLPNKYNYPRKSFSRYDHCLGVMLLLKKSGASEKEQIAGLIHDVSHLAFSHVADWVFGETSKEGLQDSLHKNFILKTEIPDILKKFGYKVGDFIHLDKFTLLDNHIPNICADRLDYSLKEMDLKFAKKCLENLEVYKGSYIFKNREWAKKFANKFLSIQQNHWGSREHHLRYYLFAGALKRAIKLGRLKFKDFERDDKYVLNILETISDKKIIMILALLKNKKIYYKAGRMKKVSNKFRYVDPQFVLHNELKQLSEVDKKFATKLTMVEKENNLGILCPVI